MKRILSILMVLALACSLFPMAVFASGEATPAQQETRPVEIWTCEINGLTVQAPKHYDELAAAYTTDDSSLYETFDELYESFANDCIEIVLGQEQSGVVTQANIDAVLATLDYVEEPVANYNAVWIYNPMQLFLDGTATLPTGTGWEIAAMPWASVLTLSLIHI